MRRLLGLIGGVLLCLAGVGAPAAQADLFGPIELASVGTGPGGLQEQAEEARFPVISANGRYVAFVGRFGGEAGIWRRDLLSGVVEQVAPGQSTMPSISANGRYVSFTTNEQLVPADENRGPDVYRRDMEPGPGESQYTLVSAVNDSEAGATYAYTGEGGSLEQRETEFGSLAGARSAMSADGEQVAFITTAQSDLLGGAEPTPAGEVLVRDIGNHETKLVSAEYQPGAGWTSERPVQPTTDEAGFTQYGAVFPGAGQTPRFGVYQGATDGQGTWLGASISANGSTVAWMGQDLGRQAQLLPDEQSDEPPQTAEPLWRRIESAPGAPIRRITGGSDPTSAACVASGEQEIPEKFVSPLDPCAGPFEHYLENSEGLWGSKAGFADFVPQLSASGETVAFITGARELAGGEEQFENAESSDDLYVVDMASGLTRVQALRRLTEIGGGGSTQEKIERSSKIVDYSVSPDGSQVAFTSQRTQFPLGSPSFVSPLAAAPGMIELFDIDLDNDTITRVTHGFEGEDARSEELPKLEVPGTDPYHLEQGAYSPSFSEDGNTLCFASSANNLVYGDGNDAPDAFVVHRVLPPSSVVQQYVSPAPANPALVPPWRLGVTAVSLRNGGVRLYVEVPGKGALGASASAGVLVHSRAKSTRRPAHRAPRGATQRLTLATRKMASTRTVVGAGGEGLVPLTLTLAPAYRALSGARGGLSAKVVVTFTAPGRPALRASLRVIFRRTSKSTKRAGKSDAVVHRSAPPAGGSAAR